MRTPHYLIAMIVAIASMPLDIYDVHARHIGIGKAEPWRSKASAALSQAVSSVQGFLRAVWGYRRQMAAAAACMLCLTLMPSDDGVALASVVIAGSVNIAQLERDLKAKKDQAGSLLSKYAQAAQAYEEKDKDGKVISTGRLLSAEEKKEV